ncbi:MAG: polysaccharide export protein [Cyanobacteria bacterium CRU_2_1]|nr:polysaccharide export protein [Cyanobacteria bacterium CRU_2_1]
MLSVTQISLPVMGLLVWSLIAPQALAQTVRPDALIPPRMPLPPAQPLSVQPPLPLNTTTPNPSSIPFPIPSTIPDGLPESIPVAMPSEGLNPITGTPDVQPASYTLAVGDRIFVGVVNVPEYSAEYQIQVDGTINLPVIGNVSVWGMTVKEAAQDITRRYTEPDVLRNPSISVLLLAASPLHIVVSGQVSRPGAYTLGLADGKFPTLTDAIQQAGGMTQLADLRQVKVIRPQRSGPNQVLQANLWTLLQSGDARQDITLRNGDSIVLPTATAINPTEAMLLGSANLSPDAMLIGILGEVRQAGTLEVPPNTPLNQVLLAAGGFNRRARRGSVELIRLNSNGTVTRKRIQVDLSSGIDENTNPVLTNRDVIIVGRSTLASIGDTLGTLLSPIGQAFSLFNLFNTLFPQQQSP